MNYNAVGHKFNANESKVYVKWGIFTQKHTENKVKYWEDGKYVVTRGLPRT